MSEKALSLWEELEIYLFDHNKEGSDFSAEEYAATEDIKIREASAQIQSYLLAQRKTDSNTLYVLHRLPGTRARRSRWAVGVKAKDARQIGEALFSDVENRVLIAIKPDLIRIGTINPRARKLVEKQVKAIITSALVMLKMAVVGGLVDDED